MDVWKGKRRDLGIGWLARARWWWLDLLVAIRRAIIWESVHTRCYLLVVACVFADECICVCVFMSESV